jgi:hypothetical protein
MPENLNLPIHRNDKLKRDMAVSVLMWQGKRAPPRFIPSLLGDLFGTRTDGRSPKSSKYQIVNRPKEPKF